MHKPSKYQIRLFNEITDTTNNIIVNAKAGAGKTTSIVKSLDFIPQTEPTIFLAFNKAIVTELRERITYPNVKVSTLHGFGMRMLNTHFGTLKLNENKTYVHALKLFEKYAGATKENKQSYAYRVSQLVDKARLTLTDVTDEEAMFLLACRFSIEVFENEIGGAAMVLDASNKDITHIDYTDMIYQPVYRKLKLRKYKYVYVDEVQDLNRVQQEMIRMLVNPKGGRLIAVGDPNQSIYGFAGADIASFNRMAKLFPNTVELPLSICYRCPKSGVNFAKTFVPDIEASPFADEGVLNMEGTYKDIRQGDWVLCRNTRPLVMLFIMLVNDGKNAYIKGIEIGKNLVNLIKRTKATTIEQMLERLNEDRIKLKLKLIKKRIYRPETSNQMVEFNEKFRVIKLLAKGCTTVKEVIQRIESIFLEKKEKAIVLSTIHKAKGEENDRIFVLAPELMPSKYAKTPEDFVQEDNLKYVCFTRHKKELHFIADFDIEAFGKLMEDLTL